MSCVLEAPAEAVWEAVMKPETFVYVARGRMSFRPLEPDRLPEAWAPGAYRLAMYGFGFVPLGSQTVVVEFPEPGARMLRDNGHGSLFPRWDHRIRVEPAGERRTRYTDRVDFDGVLPSWLLVPVVRAFFRHRQRRWQKLVRSGFRAAGVRRAGSPRRRGGRY